MCKVPGVVSIPPTTRANAHVLNLKDATTAAFAVVAKDEKGGKRFLSLSHLGGSCGRL